MYRNNYSDDGWDHEGWRRTAHAFITVALFLIIVGGFIGLISWLSSVAAS